MYAGGGVFAIVAAVFFFLAAFLPSPKCTPWGFVFLTASLGVYTYGPAPAGYVTGIFALVALILFIMAGIAPESPSAPRQTAWGIFFLAVSLIAYGGGIYYHSAYAH